MAGQSVKFKDVIPHIINQLASRNIYFGKTKIIKIAYLLELQYFKINKERLTDADWIFYKFGPYPINYNNYLEQSNIVISDDDYSQEISIHDDFELPRIQPEVKTLINGLVLEYGDMDLNELLNYVYFETEPMIYAIPRSKLDFSLVLKEEMGEIEIHLTKEQKKRMLEIQHKLSEELSKLPEPKFQTRFVPEDIFENGDIKHLIQH